MGTVFLHFLILLRIFPIFEEHGENSMLTVKESMQLLGQYALNRIKEQLKAVALIVS